MNKSRISTRFGVKGSAEYFSTIKSRQVSRLNPFSTQRIIMLLIIFALSTGFNGYGQCDFVSGVSYSNGAASACACTWVSGGVTNCSWGNCGNPNQVECTSLTDCNGVWTNGTGGAGLVVCGVVLPAEMVAFYGEGEGERINVYWVTSTELNNDHFDLYHSIDLDHFEFMTSIPGTGSTQEESKYHFYHNNAEAGIHYYRLTQVDVNGDTEVSDVISVTYKVNNKEGDFSKAYPNPIKANCNVNYTGNDFSSKIELSIFSLKGERVYQKVIVSFNNFTGIQVPVDDLSNGIYILELTQNEKSERQRLNVVH